MKWLYPKVRNFMQIIPWLINGLLIGGIFGALHDQISYTISPEYFTEYKFLQFSYADFGLPDRVFAGIIGFIAGGAPGICIAWLFGRIRYSSDNLETAKWDMTVGFITVLAFAASFLILGALAGYIRAYHFPLETFMGWEELINKNKLQNFAVVGYIHNFGYLGGLAGVITVIIKMRKSMKQIEGTTDEG